MVHEVHLRKSTFIRTQISSESALAERCGTAFTVGPGIAPGQPKGSRTVPPVGNDTEAW